MKWILKFVLLMICFSFLSTAANAAKTPAVTDPAQIQSAIQEAYQKFRNENGGHVATYIPELGKVNPALFGIAVVTADGKVYQVGDTNHPFAIESISKLFAYALALKDQGDAFMVNNIGTYATGLPFNSILAGIVREIKLQNPFVNYGAIQVTSVIKGQNSKEKWQRVADILSDFANAKLPLSQAVYVSETQTNYNNRALANLAKNNNKMFSDAMDAVDRYTKACSLMVTAKELATMGATIANDGTNPMSHKQVISPIFVPKLLAMMITAGLYDESGYWNYTVGVPGKSGVGGGILAIVPHEYAIAIFSPPLNAHGNSVRGIAVMQYLSQKLHLNLYSDNKKLHHSIGVRNCVMNFIAQIAEQKSTGSRQWILIP